MFVYGRYSEIDFAFVRALAAEGLSGYEISRRTGIPRSTVQRWRTRSRAPHGATARAALARAADDWPPDGLGAGYSYLLGVYLGDGHLVRLGPNAYRLDVYCDAGYPALIAEIRAAVSECAPGVITSIRYRGENCVVIAASSPLWPLAFPQHGPGRKHERPILLEPWQLEITRSHPEALLRGLIHSDGCRSVNRFRTKLPSGRVGEYEYPRYFFSNLSADIRRIFCDHCELLGIRWTQSNPRNISVSHRRSVAKLDGFIGPKR